MLADALHRRHEFVADRIIFRSALPGEGLRGWKRRGQQRRSGKYNYGAQQRPELGRHARIMVVECNPHEI
jgi:hypothetical protein